jgi:hypothetical protein
MNKSKEAGKGGAYRPTNQKKWNDAPYWKELEKRKKKENAKSTS